MSNAPLLQVRDLSIGFTTDEGTVAVTDGVSFEIDEGEVLGLAGESGCGKTISALAVLRLLPKPAAKVLSGEIIFKGESVLAMPIERLRQVRGKEIGMIFQEPSAALNPLLTVKRQLLELFDYHEIRGDPMDMIAAVLKRVGFPDPIRILGAYPHELSGGMLQRIMIALAVVLKPALIIADEPTTALDVTVQAQIMELLSEMQRETGTSVLLITHNLSLMAHYTNRLAVMYAGRIVESGESGKFFDNPLHPYSRGLLRALPDFRAETSVLEPIPGQVPHPRDYAAGCRFAPRCEQAFDACSRRPPFFSVNGQKTACFLYKDGAPCS